MIILTFKSYGTRIIRRWLQLVSPDFALFETNGLLIIYIYIGDAVREEMEYERSWLSSLMRKYIDLVYRIPAEGQGRMQQ